MIVTNHTVTIAAELVIFLLPLLKCLRSLSTSWVNRRMANGWLDSVKYLTLCDKSYASTYQQSQDRARL